MASIYQKIHALALEAQSRHRLQLQGFFQTVSNRADTSETDCSHQSRWQDESYSLEMQEPVIAPHNPQHNLGRNRSSTSDLNESIMNPIDKVISGLRYSSIPYISFETQIKPNQHSRERVVRSEDGWFKHWEENVRNASKESITASGHTDSPQMPELDSDTDSSSSASSTYSSQAKNWLRTTDEVVRGDSLEEGHDKKLSQSHGNEAPYLKKVKGHIIPQDIPLKGMARLRRISPKAISTTGLLDVESNRLSFIFIT